MNCPSLSETGVFPDRYIKPPTQRPTPIFSNSDQATHTNIPIIDFQGLDDDYLRATTLGQISEACRDWGFFQVVNHGVSPGLMDRTQEVWRQFFHLPMELKQAYANSPKTYEGYGSRLGVEKGAILDWSDYYFLHYLPLCLKDYDKWPALPGYAREVIDEYGKEVVKLCGRIMKILALNLGLEEDFLQKRFGGEDIGACLRVNFYPKKLHVLTKLLHSSIFVIFLLIDCIISRYPSTHNNHRNSGFSVLSNATYKSIEHRVIVNPAKERLSLAFFYNPKSDIAIEPAKELVTPERPALYPPMTFNEYRLYIRLNGPRGKSQVDSLKSPRK
ncbi:hypothetical protein GBA52_006634 [Prunus armeniaca]|nr:hypothetical protein GBA52_006634 [Prunus armeniaca]